MIVQILWEAGQAALVCFVVLVLLSLLTHDAFEPDTDQDQDQEVINDESPTPQEGELTHDEPTDHVA